MYTIAKKFSFSASHQLPKVPPGHQCGRLHGHNYEVEVVVSAEDLDEKGFVVDYAELGKFKTWVDDHLDHRHLNDIMENPTAELLSLYLREIAIASLSIDRRPALTVTVRVSETPKTIAEATP